MDKQKSALVDWNRLINYLGLVGIGIFCFLYSMYVASFAEKNICIAALDLPIFVGEMLLAWCMILLFVKWRNQGFPWDRGVIGLVLYLAWILFKALGPGGYWGGYGALSFRNAALFYYFLFGVLGYSFYDRRFFSPLITFLLMALLGTTLCLEMVNDYYWLAYVLLFTFLALHLPQKWQTYASLAAGLFFFTWRTLLFGSSRAHLIGVSAAFLYFFFNIVFVFMPFRLRYKCLVLAGLTVLFGLAVLRFADPNALKSLTTPYRVVKQFNEWDAFVREQEKSFVFEEMPVSLYNPNPIPFQVKQNKIFVPYWGQKKSTSVEKSVARTSVGKNFVSRSEPKIIKIYSPTTNKLEVITSKIEKKPIISVQPKIFSPKKQTVMAQDGSATVPKEIMVVSVASAQGPASSPRVNTNPGPVIVNSPRAATDLPRTEALPKPEFTLSGAEKKAAAMQQHIAKVMQETSADAVPDETKNRSLEIAYGNIHFRLFIWRDMLEEWLASPKNILFGVGFGRAQRSRSMEIIGWGKLELQRTGWITPHNAYMHMVYRAGIAGLLIVIAIFGVLIRLIWDFARQKSLSGSLLVMCLIYWLFFSFFSIFLEVPYTAIPFWSLFGMALAYANKQDAKKGPS